MRWEAKISDKNLLYWLRKTNITDISAKEITKEAQRTEHCWGICGKRNHGYEEWLLCVTQRERLLTWTGTLLGVGFVFHSELEGEWKWKLRGGPRAFPAGHSVGHPLSTHGMMSNGRLERLGEGIRKVQIRKPSLWLYGQGRRKRCQVDRSRGQQNRFWVVFMMEVKTRHWT